MSARPAPQRSNPSELTDPVTAPLLYMFRSTVLPAKTSKFKDILNYIYSLFGRCSVVQQIEDWKSLITSAFTLSVIVLQTNENDEDHSWDLVASGTKSQIAPDWITFVFQFKVLLKSQKALFGSSFGSTVPGSFWANEGRASLSFRWLHTNENKDHYSACWAL